jgi:hypothetical protein
MPVIAGAMVSPDCPQHVTQIADQSRVDDGRLRFARSWFHMAGPRRFLHGKLGRDG